MPRISEFYGIIIEMYWSDHNPPHFHAKYGEHRAEIDIRTLGVLKGRLPAKAMALVVEWASLHQDELLKRWELARQHKPFEKIEPLL
jgi:hypothetical protein